MDQEEINIKLAEKIGETNKRFPKVMQLVGPSMGYFDIEKYGLLKVAAVRKLACVTPGRHHDGTNGFFAPNEAEMAIFQIDLLANPGVNRLQLAQLLPLFEAEERAMGGQQ